ncbi:hypothetical protein A3F28_03490 [Candidatus Uhrbacteria bacterium RIFCSPHIGHO2_12_FULL_57_11]|uniref:Cation-transporting P-type ATPase N-terminal domain-containing protein n=2 Tax=Candidatus Uhriibacteriota TaxID=1752732 RepID=A0A1F7UNE2_9BACT|nr:MAG: hypothetical protein A3D72_04355 [Candidatus Uhrbacteria bacterium RIFCSPHIGHO2_02_FULL_57_19]OGL79274.1 MAG: hypothetical protein A3F28_03490 [Candidatus Uhrbacteria bacterium RIFCSPHIGHO2_12_FULL_57_11]
MKSYQIYAGKSVEETLRELMSSPEGLSSTESAARLVRYGKNEVRGREVKFYEVLFRQFWTPLTWLLLAAAGISLILREFADSAIIAVILLINTGLGFVQEYRSEAAVRRLRSFLTSRARVRRDGKTAWINRVEIVPGDVVLLEPGDMAPADMRVITEEGLQVDESVLTGESEPTGKNTGAMTSPPDGPQKTENIIFSGTTVVSGSVCGDVIATGGETEFGSIAHLTGEARRRSSFEENLASFSRFILKLVLITLAVVFVANLLIEGREANPAELLLFALALAISVVPEALPAVMTITFSRGALHLARKHVVVKRLSSIEDLGHIEVLCTDKTGTITQNRMAVNQIIARDAEACLRWAFFTVEISEKGKEPVNPFDRAIWQKLPTSKIQLPTSKVLHELPFDHGRRRGSLIAEVDDRPTLIVKGAPEVVLGLSASDSGKPLTEAARKHILAEFELLGRAGMRALAIAVRSAEGMTKLEESDERNLDFQGLIGFIDPLKPSAKEAIRVAEQLKVRVKILTGDSKEVAGAVAAEIGIINTAADVITGAELEKLPPDEFERAVEEHDVMARVTPEQKYRIIEAIQKKQAVGFLGEGLNDAPALKLANVALAVDSAADIAKEAADVILLDKSLSVIVDGIREGRIIVANVAKYMRYTMAGSVGNFYSIAAVSLFLPFLPMLPVQILLVNLLTDLPLIAVAADNVDPGELRGPKRLNVRDLALSSMFLGSVSAIFDLTFFGIFRNAPEATLQTLWFIESVTEEIAIIFVLRTMLPVFRASRPSGVLVLFAFVAAALAVIIPISGFGMSAFHFVKPSISALGIILGLIVASFIATEIVKRVYVKGMGRFRNASSLG